LVGAKERALAVCRTGFGRVVTKAESYLPLSINSVEASPNNKEMRIAIKSAFIFTFVLF